MTVRLYLAGRMAVRGPGGVADEGHLPGRQGRLLLAYLAVHARHPVPSDRVAEVLWGEQPPDTWPALLKTVVSRTRSVLQRTGLPAERTIAGLPGTYQFRPPEDVWIDLEAGVRSVDRAEAALRRHDLREAWGDATVATAIARRPFLPQEDAPWVDDVRETLRSARLRAIDCLVEVWLTRGNHALALSLASESVGLAPYRESSWRLQIRAHAAAGDRAEALRAYERCARLLEAEVGVPPTAETQALCREIKRGYAGGPAPQSAEPQPPVVGKVGA